MVKQRILPGLLIPVFLLIACSKGGTDSNTSNTTLPSNQVPEVTFNKTPYFSGNVINRDTEGRLERPTVVTDKSGNALAYWKETDGVVKRAYYKYARQSDGAWSAPVMDTDLANDFTVYPGNTGFMALWAQYSAISFKVFDGTRWTKAEPVKFNSASAPIDFQNFGRAMLTARGNDYVLVFSAQLRNTASSGIYELVYSAGAWGDVTPLITTGNNAVLQAASNGTSYAFVWVYSGNNYRLSVRTSTGTYDKTIATSAANNQIRDIVLTPSNAGYAAAWMDAGSGIARLYSSVFTETAQTPSWGAVTTMDKGTENSAKPALASNGSGYALAWVREITNAAEVVSREFAGSWTTETRLNTLAAAQDIRALKMISNRTGYAAAWYNRPAANQSGSQPYHYYGAVHTGSAWLGDVLLGVGGTADNLMFRPLSLTTNGSNYAIAWIDAPVIDTVQEPYNNVYATVSTGNTLPQNAAVKLFPTKVLYNNFVFGSLYLNLLPFNGRYEVSWENIDYTTSNILASSYRNGRWETPAPFVSIVSKGAAVNPRLARNDQGDLVAVWAQVKTGIWRHFLSRKSASANTWAEPIEITQCNHAGNYAIGAGSIQVVSNGTGFMITCFGYTQGFSLQSTWFAVPYDGTNFGERISIANFNSGALVATNGSGYAIAWAEGGQHKVRFYDGAWGNEQTVASGQANATHLTLVNNGNRYALSWSVGNTIFRSDWNAQNLRWETVSNAYSGTGFAQALTDDGVFHYAWANQDLYTMEYNGTWTMAATGIESIDNQPFTNTPALVASGANLYAAWHDTNTVYVNRFSGAWAEPVPLVTNATSVIDTPRILVNNSDYLVSWVEQTGNLAQFFIRFNRNASWSDKLSVQLSNFGAPDYAVLADGAYYRLIWSQNNAADASDTTAARIWVSGTF